jgi:hypothetical protein
LASSTKPSNEVCVPVPSFPVYIRSLSVGQQPKQVWSTSTGNPISSSTPTPQPFQYAPGVGYPPHIHGAGGSVVVTDLASAEEAIKIIVEQGEGEVKDPEHDDKSGKEKVHYEVFTEFLNGYDNGTLKWDLYPMIKDASAKNYLTKYKNNQL